ncbi:MAG: hypothetical protein ABJA82_15990 [Myxococcales bacterium]
MRLYLRNCRGATAPYVALLSISLTACGGGAPSPYGNGGSGMAGAGSGGKTGGATGSLGTGGRGGSASGGAVAIGTGGIGTAGIGSPAQGTGGSGTGGAGTGGMATGGAATGGALTGGTGAGGTGGVATGGAGSGGTGTGGIATGGAGTGGAATGGADTGGVGGAPLTACVPGTWSMDPVPGIPKGTLIGQFMDNTGHVHAGVFSYVGFENRDRFGNYDYLMHAIRPPRAGWSSYDVMISGTTYYALRDFDSDNNSIFVDPSYSTFAIINGGTGEAGLWGLRTGTIDDDSFHPSPSLTRFEALTVDSAGKAVLLKNGLGTTEVGDGSIFLRWGETVGETLPVKGTSPQIDVDAAGTLHAVFADMASGLPRYGTRPAAGPWSTFESAPAGKLVVSAAGVPHLLRATAAGATAAGATAAGATAAGLTVATRTTSGWVDHLIDAAGVSAQHGVDKLGRVHIAYTTGTDLKYARLETGGAVHTERVAAGTVSGQVRVDRQGTVRIFTGSNIFTRCPFGDDAFQSAPPGLAASMFGFPDAAGPVVVTSRFAYDAGRGRAVLLGGELAQNDTPLVATWEWNGATGTWASGGPARAVANTFGVTFYISSAGYDWGAGKLIGIGSNAGTFGTWRWDGAGTGWTAVSTSFPGMPTSWPDNFREVLRPGVVPQVLYDGSTSALLAIDGPAVSSWTGTAWVSSSSSIGSGAPGTLVQDDERKLILAFSAIAAMPVRIWEWRGVSGWMERSGPSGQSVPTGPGVLVTGGDGRMVFWPQAGQPWVWTASTATWTATWTSVRTGFYPRPAYAGRGRILLQGTPNFYSYYQPPPHDALPISQPAFLYITGATWEWTAP